MLKVNDYVCELGHSTEVFSKGQPPETIECHECGKPATKALAAPRCKLEGTSGSFPGAAMQWDRKRAEKMAQERKKSLSHGE